MRIGIDARMYTKGFGLARYTQQLIHHLVQITTQDEYVCFVRPEGRSALQAFVDAHAVVSVEIIEVDIPWYSWKEQVFFPRYIRRAQVDVMHFPHWNIPLMYRGPFVVTIHDLIMYHYVRPEATTLGPLMFWIKDRVHRMVVRHAVRRARHIITTSAFTSQDVHTTLGVPMERMTVTYQAPFALVDSIEDSSAVLERFGIEKPYALYVGAAYPHKNVETLIEAWNMFVDTYGDTHQLVLVGKENAFYARVKEQIVNTPHIIYTGFVSDETLGGFYAAASAYVFVSLYEGFGLPPLEAMTHNVPVIAASASCLPEVLGEGAAYVDPHNAAHIAETVHAVLTDEHLRHTLQTKAKETVARYSWDRLAKETHLIYQDAL